MTETTTGSGLRDADIQTGTGATATGAGQTMIVHDTGWLEADTRFDSSRDRDTPFSFPRDCGPAIPGRVVGIKGMRVGGIRRLVIPAAPGYGSRGAGGVIAPEATLAFETELPEIST
ncbi:MAG: FKBP-type peptidyl-prolyl cis-trans isomerase [Gammaproteobacteria bacterium]|jgi:FKBP-type peptidyl-prolyl cis-trans isomerase FkpA